MTVAVHTRLATEADLPAISAIYNHYVLHSTCTYQTEPETLAARQAWFAERSAAHPATVAESEGRVIGWASLSPYNKRAAYCHTVEASVYLHHEYHRRGVGRALLAHLIDLARGAGHHCIIGGASADQTASIALQASLGFVKVGHMREVGFKFGRWLDVVYMQLML